MPLFARSFGVNNAQVGAILSAFAFARFASGLIAGKLVDTFGERMVYSVGIGFVAISSAAAAMAQSYSQLLLFRAAGGLGSSMFSVAAGSLLLRVTSDHQRGRAQSLYNGSFLIGMVGGPVVGGALSAFSLRAPLAIYAFLLAISSISAGLLLRGSMLAAKPEGKSEKTSLMEALRLQPYRIALAISFSTGFIIFGMGRSIVPLFMVEDMHVSTTYMGVGFTIASIVNGLLLLRAGRLSDEKGRRFVAVIGSSALFISTTLLVFTVQAWIFFPAMIFSGIAGAYLATVPGSLVGDVLKGKGGQVIAVQQMSGDFAAMVSPVLLGAISDAGGFRPAFILSAILMAAVILVTTRIPETRNSVHLQG
ncbi:ProP Permeases of the major facilitator superfamily [Candidatus Nanopelagicaceae bacterium]